MTESVEKVKRINATLGFDLWFRLRTEALKRDIPLTELIQLFIEESLDRSDKEDSR